MRKTLVACLLVSMNSIGAEEVLSSWNGFSITPGAGLRHLGLDVIRKSDGFTGNIAQEVGDKLFVSLNIESPRYRFENSNWGVSIANYNSFVTLDSQWYNFSTGGERINVGTEVSGRYSYLMPQIFYETGRPGTGSFKFSLGYGIWNADLSGTIKLTPNDTPGPFTPITNIDVKTTHAAYFMSLSYRTKSNWIYEMSVGGVDFNDSSYDYSIEEITLTIGKTFML